MPVFDMFPVFNAPVRNGHWTPTSEFFFLVEELMVHKIGQNVKVPTLRHMDSLTLHVLLNFL